MKIQIDAGHGEIRTDNGTYDPGAVGPSGITEASVALSIALKTGEILKKSGFQVFYTRTKDRELDSWYKIDEVFNKNNIDMLISIHCNAFNGQAQGIETFYNSYSTAGHFFAGIIQDNMLNSFPGHIDRGLKTKSLKVTNLSSSVPIVLLECEFIDHPEQEKFLKSSENQQKIAEVMLKSILQYYGKKELSAPSASSGKINKAKIKAYIKKYCDEYELNYHDILAQALVENAKLDPAAVSGSEAIGVAQIKLPTAEYICRRHKMPAPSKNDLLNPEYNCKLFCIIMADMLKKAEEHKYETARLLYHDGEWSMEKGKNTPKGAEYLNKVIEKKEKIKPFV